jgi:hypothetical protein
LGKVFVTASREPEAADVEGVEPYAQVPWPGGYFFLYQDILRLAEQTGELIDPQRHGYFSGAALDALDQFLQTSRSRVLAQPESWEQRVGTQHPSGEPVFMPAARDRLLSFLDGVDSAIAAARVSNTGVFFCGE